VTSEEGRDLVARRIADWYAAAQVANPSHEREVIAAAAVVKPRGRRYLGWVAAGCAAAALVVGVAMSREWRPAETVPTGTVTVRLVLRGAGTAAHVAVVGDFNGWNATATPLGRAPSGAAWIVDVHVPPGRYGYAFVVDGHEWITDPTAPLAPDAFGHPTSVLVVGAGGAA
jgi:hypothetical protein